MRSIIVNFFGGPGSGKTTLRAGVFYHLKLQQVQAEEVTEAVKTYIFEGRDQALACQERIFGRQLFDLQRLRDKAAVVVTDAPLLQQIHYGRKAGAPEAFEHLVRHHAARFDNVNFFVERGTAYQTQGRYQDEAEADSVAAAIKGILDELNVPYTTVRSGGGELAPSIAHEVSRMLSASTPVA